MIRCLMTAVLLLGTLHTEAVAAAGGAGPVVVQDPYLELRSGPGRGFPVFHVVDRGASVELLRRRTDWIKVRGGDGAQGWVHRSQLERTLTPGGEPVTLPGPSPEARTEHRWEVGLVGPCRRSAASRRLLEWLARHGRCRAPLRAALARVAVRRHRRRRAVRRAKGHARPARRPHRFDRLRRPRPARLPHQPLPVAGGVPAVRRLHEP